MKNDHSKKTTNSHLTQKQRDDKKVDEASRESFPASDPPAWYAGKDKKQESK